MVFYEGVPSIEEKIPNISVSIIIIYKEHIYYIVSIKSDVYFTFHPKIVNAIEVYVILLTIMNDFLHKIRQLWILWRYKGHKLLTYSHVLNVTLDTWDSDCRHCCRLWHTLWDPCISYRLIATVNLIDLTLYRMLKSNVVSIWSKVWLRQHNNTCIMVHQNLDK